MRCIYLSIPFSTSYLDQTSIAIHIFVVEEDICVGKSKAKANKKYGDGGATQYYIRDMDKSKLTSTGKLRSFRR